jgi:hypothetical protein
MPPPTYPWPCYLVRSSLSIYSITSLKTSTSGKAFFLSSSLNLNISFQLQKKFDAPTPSAPIYQ